MMTGVGHEKKRPPHHLSHRENILKRDTVRLAGTKSTSPVLQPSQDPTSPIPSPSLIGKKRLAPLGREGAIVLESKLSTRVYSRGPSVLEHTNADKVEASVGARVGPAAAAENIRQSRIALLTQRRRHDSPPRTLSSLA